MRTASGVPLDQYRGTNGFRSKRFYRVERAFTVRKLHDYKRTLVEVFFRINSVYPNAC